MKGILLINKAKEMTSHDVVAILRRKLNIKRIGHTGTLDPMVTGVLPICIGNATRVSEYIMHQGKTYICKMKFGQATTTYDAYGEVTDSSDKVDFTKEEILNGLKHFTGEIEQTPPIYSAIKIKGKKLYDYARSGQSLDIPKRKVNIYSLDLLDIDGPEISFRVSCSKGTYVRSLVHELGLYLGTFAYMTDLVRTKVGRFELDACIDINNIDDYSLEDIEKSLISIENSLYNLGRIEISDPVALRLINGQKLNLNTLNFRITNNHNDTLDEDNLMVFVMGDFLGIGKLSNNIIKMERVLKSD